MKKIAYQGLPGAFSHLTAVKAFGQGNTFLGLETFKNVFDHLQDEAVDLAIIPIENTLAGSIYENYDWMLLYNMHILAEHYTKITHCLLTYRQQDIKKIQKVFSHPKALEQCKNFFLQYPWIEVIPYFDTAGAAQSVSQWQNEALAAIASEQAGQIYQLDVLKKGIEDNPQNYTRFLTISNHPCQNIEHANKVSLQIIVKHQIGALNQVLNFFSHLGVNLTKIESRPLAGKLFEYQFYLDLEIPKNVRIFPVFLIELQKMVVSLTLLGYYPAGIK